MLRLSLVLILCLFAGCTKTQPVASPSAASPEEVAAKLIRRGLITYQTNCTTCHNTDPTKAGAVGPVVAGASLELVEARLLRGTYPEGYQGQRSTKVMPMFPQLKDDIPAIVAYLQSVK